MSKGLGKLFKNNKQTTVVSKYLSQTSADQVGDGIESAGHLSESIKKRDAYIPPVDYSIPKNFVRFGSAEKYYNDAFSYIAGYYPYDGSGFEKTKFFNDLNPLENYLFQEKYPRSTGYVLFNPTWGTRTSLTDGYGFASATPSEYIQTKGGPHSGNIYSQPEYRTSNLEFGGASGSTVEFFYNKTTGMPDNSVQGEKQVIFDLWNGVVSSSADYGRLRIEVFSGSEDRFHVTLLSGTTGFFTQSVPTTGGLTNLCSGSWHHYAFAFDTSTTGDVSTYVPSIDFYVDGVCVETNIVPTGRVPGGPQGHTGGGIGVITGSLISNLGSLRAAPSASLEGSADSELTLEGYGKLSASLDEFRFWKSQRNPEEVGRYWFTHVDGGSNKYDANKDLGVYYKFNEGITNTATIDSVILDYSGRISNGNYVAYDASYSRNTGSAIDTMNIENVFETKDPIVRKTNPLYTNELSSLSITGSTYDVNNNGRLEDKIPTWIIEENDNLGGELKDVIQILSTYFDTLRLQMSQINQIKNLEYVSGSLTGSSKPFPHNDRVLDNFGLETPEIFENIGALGQFLQRDEQIKFDQELVNTKNLIYKNVYNNLITIYKQKGTPQSIRNFVRCLGVGEEIISLNTYANNSDYFLTSSYKGLSSTKKYVDFSGLVSTTSNTAVVYQYYDSNNPNSYGLISEAGGTGEANLKEFAFTLEGEFIFPDRSNIDALSFVPYFPVTSSLFGFHTPDDTSPTSTDLTWASAVNDFGLRVVAIKSPGAYAKITAPAERVNDVYFAVLDRSNNTLLTSSIYTEVYNNEKWNLALRLKPKKYPFAEGIRGTTFSGGSALEYDLELYGSNYSSGVRKNYFSAKVDYSYTNGAGTLNSAKRIFLGAHRTNFNGSLLDYSDVRATSCRYWTNYLTDENIDLHAKESFSFGTMHPYQNSYYFQTEKPNVFIPEIQTLAMNWDFANVTGSDASGQFTVSDFSSGSVSGYPSSYQDNIGSTFSDINLRQHTGRGDLFDASFSTVKKQYIYTEKKQVPDYATSSEMIKVLASDDEYFNINYRPENLFFAVEKSMYKNISERMLQLFASIQEFNNLIGEPVNKYRPEYKALEKMREIFFRNVQDVPDFDKYLRFYKWLDVSMGEMIQQLMPASVAKAENVRTLVESHMLERQKIKYSYPGAYKTRTPNVAGTVRNLGSICPDQPGWKFNHAPLNTDDSKPQQNNNCFWWNTKTARANGQFGTLAAGALATRQAVFTQVQSDFSSSQIVCLSADLKTPIIGGINQPLNKRRRITDVTFSAFEEMEDCDDEIIPNQKVRFTYKGVKDGVSYKGELVSPFTLLSASTNLNGHKVKIGTYGDGEIANIILTNLHEDSLQSFDHSVPMQGPFTRTHVGGIQARHVNPLAGMPVSGSDRRESNRLTIGTSDISLTSVTVAANEGAEVPKGQYVRGNRGKSILNIANLRTVTGSSPIQARALIVIDDSGGIVHGETFTLTDAEGLDTTYRINGGVLPENGGGLSGGTCDVGFSGVGGGAAGKVAAAAAMVIAINNTIRPNPLYTAVSNGIDTVTITQTTAGLEGNKATTSTLSSTEVSDFVGGLGSIGRSGINEIGNFEFNYQVLQTNDRAATNIDFVFNNSNYFTGSIPTAFLTTPAMRNTGLGRTGSLDYPAPRQIANRRKTESVFVNRFAAPGSTVDSRQQFRDIPSDQLSPNNALPFRNIPVRKTYNTEMKNYTGWGGFITSSGQNILDAFGGNVLTELNNGVPPYNGHAAEHKTQRNTVQRLSIVRGEVTAGSGVTIGTGSLRNNDFYTSPIPAADRTSWFMNLSGTQIQGVAATATILVTDSGGVINGETFKLVDPTGLSTQYTINGGVDPAAGGGSGGAATVGFNGVGGGGAGKVAACSAIAIAINATTDANYIALSNGVDTVTVTQGVMGTSGDKTNTDAITGVQVGNFTGGVNMPPLNLMNQFIVSSSHYPANITITTSSIIQDNLQYASAVYAVFPYEATYIWNNGLGRPGFVPWTQTRQMYSQFGNYYVKNNRYDFYIDNPVMSLGERVDYGNTDYTSPGVSLETFTLVDRASNSISYYPRKRFKEPPITSKYKPLYHKIKSYVGTPAKSAYDIPIETNVRYSYGNYLMGFANRGINSELTPGGSTTWRTGKIRRPYESFRDNYNSQVPKTVDGVDIIRLTNYSETVYPQEVYTYLSASRSRLVFENNFWRNDQKVDTSTFAATVNSVTAIGEDPNIHRYARNMPRIRTPFTNSQGYILQRSEQLSYDTVAGGKEGDGPGSGSLWPMDSYIFSDLTSSLDAVQDSGGFEVGLAAASSLPCGELMMTSHGEVKTVSSGPYSVYERASAVSAQYIYSAPAMAVSCGTVSAIAATGTITALVAPSAATAAEAQITVNYAEGQGITAATAQLVFGSTANDTSTDGQIVTIQDLTTAFSFQFDKDVTGTTFTAPKSYVIGTGNGSGGQLTPTEVRDALFTAIQDAGSTPSVTLKATAAKDGSLTINLTATVLGAAMNTTGVVDYTDAGSASGQITVSTWGAGTMTPGADYTYGSSATAKTLTIDDPSTVSFAFESTLAPGSSTSTTIGTNGASAADIAAAIRQTINLSSIAVTAGTVVGAAVPLTADTTGTSMNGEPIAGTAESTSGITAVDFADGAAAVSLTGQTILMGYKKADGSTGTQTMTFGATSNATTIDVSTVTTVGAVALAIEDTIDAGTATHDITAAVVGAQVNLTAATAGTHQNGQTIAGTAESGGTISAADFSGGAAASTLCEYDVLPKSPGGISSRPSWTAPIERRSVQGPNRGELLNGRSPFYNSYAEYAADVRLKGQEYTIVPEYRMSENLENYDLNGTPFALVSKTLELTGANATNFDSSNPAFFDRYMNSDKMQYLSPFMETDTVDFTFNKFPKHMKLESKAVVKLLPYDGFYPADRSLQIASLFSSSYSYAFSGVSGSTRQAMRALLRPFYAPGIFYNSIKSGIAVDHPTRRVGRNENQFMQKNAFDILGGALSGTLTTPVDGEIPGNVDLPNPERRRFNGNNPLTVGQAPIDFRLNNTDEFYWADRLPFESILRPEDYIYNRLQGKDTKETILSDLNEVLFNDVTGSITAIQNDLYKKAISNFLGATPEFFLKKKINTNGSDGYMTKFVGVLGSQDIAPENLGFDFSTDPQTATLPLAPARPVESKVYASMDNAYIMEIGLTKTDQFNMYNNPYAFGPPTATGSAAWALYNSGSEGNQGAERPSGSAWPKHRGEFAPFTPPYFYGTSFARITFMPPESREYSLNEIVGINAAHTQIEFVNESGSYYDFSLDTYLDLNLTERKTTKTPPYGWNRAWQNRMDIDASICLTNVFPLENGSTSPAQSGKWVIMPKWECPVLDFPNWGTTRSDGNIYSFSSSVTPGSFDGTEGGAYGMWHQYGVMPSEGQGIFMYIKDVDLKETEVRLVGDPSAGVSSATGQQIQVRKVPKVVIDSGKTISSLADLTGFDPEEVMRGGFDIRKAKRLGEIAEDGEKKVCEAILAMPYWLDKDSKPKFMTIQASATELGPKIKEFRRKFTKYSLPPALAAHLAILVPKSYPEIPNYINPFGGDDLDETLLGVEFGSGNRSAETPVVYLLEHSVQFSRQDLADIWQGILPDIGKSLQMDVSAVDHYVRVPEQYRGGFNMDLDPQLPEILESQMDLGVERTGIPRYDMLNISSDPNRSSDGLNIDIKWLVFKVKQRGTKSYDKMMLKELNGLTYDPFKASLAQAGRNNPLMQDTAAAAAYFDNNAVASPTYNWPYDYMSLVEMDKITVSAGFRPDVDKEVREIIGEEPIEPPGQLLPNAAEFSDAIVGTQGAIQGALGEVQDNRRNETAAVPNLQQATLNQATAAMSANLSIAPGAFSDDDGGQY